ncbi:hypothetical protein K501DRAFT_328586 [Backusella circina FSU 941]|nr:hypothetical protein K501DRAFT_234603 [Backusella circina FSU 941]KAI8890187.1 hypothetical protein K501DRAFT_328586 [Backusella circina FSU 941]
MFLYRRSLLGLTANTTRKNARLTLTRFNSSSCRDNKENQVSQTDDTTTTTTTTANNDNEQQQQQQQLSFMPVINIPETELAHNAFFSLHRPLLGLSDKHERSFFSNRQELDESPDDQLANYMMSVQAYVPPSVPGQDQQDDNVIVEAALDEDDTLVSIEFTTEQEQEEIYQSNLPVFHMPESADIVDYLTSIQTKLKASDQKLANEEQRLKKMEILSNGKTSNRHRGHVHNRLRRFQLRNWKK